MESAERYPGHWRSRSYIQPLTFERKLQVRTLFGLTIDIKKVFNRKHLHLIRYVYICLPMPGLLLGYVEM